MFGGVEQAIGPGVRRIEGLQFGFGKLVQFERCARTFAQSAFHAGGVKPPVHLETVAGEACVQAVAHVAVFRAAVSFADRTEFGDVEVSVTAEKRIIRPGDVVETLLAHHLPLGTFECKAQAGITPIRVDTQHVGAMFWVRAIRQHIKAGEPKNKANHCDS